MSVTLRSCRTRESYILPERVFYSLTRLPFHLRPVPASRRGMPEKILGFCTAVVSTSLYARAAVRSPSANRLHSNRPHTMPPHTVDRISAYGLLLRLLPDEYQTYNKQTFLNNFFAVYIYLLVSDDQEYRYKYRYYIYEICKKPCILHSIKTILSGAPV